MNTVALQENSPVITVFKRDKTLQCNEFGEVHGWHHKLQVQHGRKNRSRTRQCLHRLEPMPHTMLFGEHVFRHNWQPVYVPRCGAIISRISDIVSISFDQIGDIQGCRALPTARIPENRWQYRLYPMRWWDDDKPLTNVFLGVWPD